MKSKNTRYALTLAILGATSAVAAPPNDGMADLSFSDDGEQIILFDEEGTPGTDQAFDAVKDSLGRTYVIGTVTTANGDRIGITRLDKNGDIDLSYGPAGDGRVVAPGEMGFHLSGVAATLDNQGFLLVAGTLNTNANLDFAVCRLNPQGDLAPFAGADELCVSVGFDLGGPAARSDILSDIIVQSDGKIVLVGRAQASNAPFTVHGAVARLETNGILDNSFDGDGKQSFLVSDGMLDTTEIRLNAAAIAANGKIIVVGSCQLEGFTDGDPCIARLTTGGQLDNSFDGDGFNTYWEQIDGPGDAQFNAVSVLPRVAPLQLLLDQEFMAIGEVEKSIDAGVYNGLVARIETSGSLDDSFNGDGFQLDLIGASMTLKDVETSYDHSVTVVGTVTTPQDTELFYVSRFLADGSKDLGGFNAPIGYTTVDFLPNTNRDQANAVVFHSNRMVVAGTTARANPGDSDYAAFGVVRDRIFHDGTELLTQ